MRLQDETYMAEEFVAQTLSLPRRESSRRVSEAVKTATKRLDIIVEAADLAPELKAH